MSKALVLISLALLGSSLPAKKWRRTDPRYAEMYRAVQKGDPQTVRRLLDDGCDPNLQFNDGESLLMCTAVAGHLNVAKILLAHGEAIDMTDSFGCTAFGLAVVNHRFEFADYLLSKGAWIDGGFSPAMVWAADRSDVTAITYLGKHDADLDICSGSLRETALMAAIERGRPDVVKALLDLGASTELSNGTVTLLELARKKGNQKVIQLILAAQKKRE